MHSLVVINFENMNAPKLLSIYQNNEPSFKYQISRKTTENNKENGLLREFLVHQISGAA